MPVIPYESHNPQVGENVFVAPDAWVIGKTSLANDVSVFFGAVARGDILEIRVGTGSNIQEHAVLHTSHGLCDCLIGAHVTIGHAAIIHGCEINDRCIIGMGAVVLDGAQIGQDSIVGAQALVPMHSKFPPRSLIVGVPAKAVRALRDSEVASIVNSAKHYVELARAYRRHFAS